MSWLKLKEDYTPHERKWWHLPLLLILIGGTIYIALDYNGQLNKDATGQRWNQTTLQRNEGIVFGTIYHITYECGKDLQEGIDKTLHDVDFSLSPFNPQSTITAINNNTSKKPDASFTEVFQLAKQISTATNGAFDITVAPLVNAWGFGFRNAENIDSVKIDSILQFVGFEKVALRNGEVEKADQRLMLDCSAIAKGYGVDAVGKYLEGKGVKNYMVEIGGEVRVRGNNPQGALWHIGITKPVDDSLSVNGELQQIVKVSDISMATSGNYRNFYEKDGMKYAHTIDPRTGRPVQHSILSSTVFADDCATADAYATSFMVLGLQQARQLLRQHPELKAYFIYNDEKGVLQTWHSEGLELEDVN